MLATGGIGTALGVIRVAHQQGRVSEVFTCEARPLRQGSRLTAWELARCDIPCTVVVDSAAASIMAQGRVDAVIVGADRIAANGDFANKIGTQNLAVIAKNYGIPFYVAAPRSTIDLDASTGDAIPIEQRPASEIETAEGVSVYNPAFDVTPSSMITAIVTDGGVIEPPFIESVPALFGGDANRPGVTLSGLGQRR
jgi:methylthioribose-1-phosphate isomerase